MKAILLSLSLSISMLSVAQSNSDSSLFNKDSGINQLEPGSTVAPDSQPQKISQEGMNKDLEDILHLQKKREEKAKRDAVLRISFGVLLLVILIIGLRRKKKGQENISRD